ncbi:MAG: hypothetical protein ACJ72V_15575 [Nitrososphaeraceae archaeon]
MEKFFENIKQNDGNNNSKRKEAEAQEVVLFSQRMMRQSLTKYTQMEVTMRNKPAFTRGLATPIYYFAAATRG